VMRRAIADAAEILRVDGNKKTVQALRAGTGLKVRRKYARSGCSTPRPPSRVVSGNERAGLLAQDAIPVLPDTRASVDRWGGFPRHDRRESLTVAGPRRIHTGFQLMARS
jgi:hypothetical protein